VMASSEQEVSAAACPPAADFVCLDIGYEML
jgi:hypothetical protein